MGTSKKKKKCLRDRRAVNRQTKERNEVLAVSRAAHCFSVT